MLDRLFLQADEASSEAHAALADLSDEAQDQLMRSKSDYLDFYTRLKSLPLAVSREVGALLYMLARHSGARTIVEFGTSFGLSTLCLAAVLRDNGDAHLITTEFEPSKVAQARDNLAEAGLSDLVETREGDALQTLSINLPGRIDLVLLDGAKVLYPEILGLLQDHFRPGGLLIADDADYSPEYLAQVRSPATDICPRYSATP
ncbi:MAG: class I SAM-dependent methyltransferase [Rhodanobacter sp.]